MSLYIEASITHPRTVEGGFKRLEHLGRDQTKLELKKSGPLLGPIGLQSMVQVLMPDLYAESYIPQTWTGLISIIVVL